MEVARRGRPAHLPTSLCCTLQMRHSIRSSLQSLKGARGEHGMPRRSTNRSLASCQWQPPAYQPSCLRHLRVQLHHVIIWNNSSFFYVLGRDRPSMHRRTSPAIRSGCGCSCTTCPGCMDPLSLAAATAACTQVKCIALLAY